MTLWLVTMYHHTKFDYKRFNSSEKIVQTKPRHTDRQTDTMIPISRIMKNLWYPRMSLHSFLTMTEVYTPVIHSHSVFVLLNSCRQQKTAR